MTRRLLFKYALGSTTGAGGAGAASAEGAGAATGAEDPQLLHPPVQPDPQESQAAASQQDFFLKIIPSNFGRLILRPHPHPLSQDGAQAVSQPQLGAALQPLLHGSAISHPQVGPAPQPLLHGDSHPQLGSAISQPQDGPASQHPLLQASFALTFLRRAKRGFLRGVQQGSATSHPQLGAAQLGAAISQPQDGPAPQPLLHGSAISHPQLGSALQPLLQPEANSHPQLGSTTVSQQLVSQPQPLPPSIRLSRPCPKLWLQRLTPRTKVPISMFHFIEPHLPMR